jgi:hypothetical protein
VEKIVTSLKKHSLTKDIRKTLGTLDPILSKNNNLSDVFRKLYEEELIGEHELVSLETKTMLTQFCLLMEKNFDDLHCGVYVFDDKEKKLWNGATPTIPEGYNEYTNGLSVINDIKEGDNAPVYVKNTVAVGDVERGEDITSLNHKRDVLGNGLQSFCCSPLEHNGKMIGHSVMFSPNKRIYTAQEIRLFAQYNKLIEERLIDMKEQLITFIKNSKMA